MAAHASFVDRIMAVVVPTGPQAFAAIVLSAGIISIAQSSTFLERIGITSAAITASQDQFHARFDVILRSDIASHIALVTFWAVVGLLAYLVCWGAYNMLIEARNEVTLNTAYTNRGHWRGPFETLGLKAASGVGLAVSLSLLWRGASYWIAVSSQVLSDPSVTTGGWALLSVAALAFQLYAVFVFAQLTFTPWYRAEAFTDV